MKSISGCFGSLLSGASLIIIMLTIITLMTIVSFTSLFFANALGSESCGYIHPNVFEVEVFIIDTETGTVSTSSNTSIPDEVLVLQSGTTNGEALGSALDTTLAVYIDFSIDGEEQGEVLYDFNDDDGGLNSALYNVIVPSSFTEPETGTQYVINSVIVEVGTYESLYAGDFTLDIVDSSEQVDIEAIAANQPAFSVFENFLTTNGTIDAGETVRYEFSPELFESGVNLFVFGTQESPSAPLEQAQNSQAETSQITTSSFWGITLYNGNEVRTRWRSCLSYYGYFNDNSFVTNEEGFNRFVPEGHFRRKVLQICGVQEGPTVFSEIRTSDCALSANVKISDNGRLVFFFLVPLLVIVLPIAIAGAIAKRGGWLWFIFMIFVAIQANATALMLIHLSQVSQIDSLSEFGYGIFTGIITGAALAFLDQLMDRIASKEDNSSA